ncbi:MAG: ferrochelatase [Micrococcaceae bacterium]
MIDDSDKSNPHSQNIAPYDALLLCSFGGPNGKEDVMPFLRNVTAGKGIPDERLADVAEHYNHFNGKSPINELNLELQAALQTELKERGIKLPVIWGNRNWHPYSVDALRDASAFGAKRVLTLLTSAYASYSSSRQYREHLAADIQELGDIAPEIDIIRPFFNHPGFISGNYEAIVEAAEKLDGGLAGAHIIYVTHSIPDTMQLASTRTGPGYKEQHEDVRATIDAKLKEEVSENFTSSLAYCSRSGSPRTPWLEPDINDHIEEDLAPNGIKKIIIAPIGFVSDHMEVVFDLDTEALDTAKEHNLQAVRAATVGVKKTFIYGIVDMIIERAAIESGKDVEPEVTGKLGAFPDNAPSNSCRMRDGEVTGKAVIAGTKD